MDALYWYDGRWATENPKLLGPADHAFWMASMVFDGARAFDGLTPDLDLHCQRVVRSAEKMLMQPSLTWEEVQALCLEAVSRFPKGEALYIKPMFFVRMASYCRMPKKRNLCSMFLRNPCPVTRVLPPVFPVLRAPGRTWHLRMPRPRAYIRIASVLFGKPPNAVLTTLSCSTVTAT
jgi:hypothetical protein